MLGKFLQRYNIDFQIAGFSEFEIQNNRKTLPFF